jgi:hypothetical protein
VIHDVAFYEASHWANASAISEKWMLVGYDDRGTIQDLIWVSSLPDDIAELGSIEPAQFKEISRMSIAGFFPVWETEALSAGNRIDAVQVDALIKTKPRHIDQIINVIGKASALGIKSFKGDTPLLLSSWSYCTQEIKGLQHGYRPVNFSREQNQELESAEQYLVLNIAQSRLMVGHDRDGVIKEIMWVKPLRP